MAGTFGSQLAQQQSQQQQGRTTRTDRLLALAQQRKRQALQTEAERLRTQEFVDKDVVETYYEEIPLQYVKNGEIMNVWWQMSDKQREFYLAKAKQNYNNVYTFTRTRTVRKQFTFSDYQQEYADLSADLRPYFVSPTTITTQRQAIATQGKQKIDAKITALQQRILDIQERKRKYEEWWGNLQKRGGRYDDYNAKLRNYEKDMDQLTQEISLLEGGKGQVDQGYDVQEVMSYAEEKAQFQRDKSDNAYMQREKFKKELEKGTFAEELKTLNLPYLEWQKKPTLQEYEGAVEKYNQNVAYTNQLKTWAGTKGFALLPTWVKEKINPSAMAWQSQYPTEKLQFDKDGNVVGVESGAYQQSLSTQAYLDKIEKQKQSTLDAQKLLKEKGFAEQYNATPPEKTFLQKGWDVAKAVGYASPFGLHTNVRETESKEATLIREERVGESLGYTKEWKENFKQLLWNLNAPKKPSTFFEIPNEAKTEYTIDYSTGNITEKKIPQSSTVIEFKPKGVNYLNSVLGLIPKADISKFSTLPFNKSLEIIKNQGALDYKAEQMDALFKELETIKSTVSPDMKQYIEEEGFKILQSKGLQTEEQTIITPATQTIDAFGNPIKTPFGVQEQKTETIIKVTDPAFERKISQHLYETELSKQTDTKIDDILVGVRGASTKAIQVYAEYRVLKGVFSGIKGVYTGLGGGLKLEKVWQTGRFSGKGIAFTEQTLKKIELTNAYAYVPPTVAKNIAKYTLTTGLAGVYGYAKVKQYRSYVETSSIAGKEAFWTMTAGEIAGIELATGMGRRAYRIAKSNVLRLADWKTPTIKEADISETGFLRENKLLSKARGTKSMERYYGRWAKPFKLSDKSTWNFRGIKEATIPHMSKTGLKFGYQKGQFTGMAQKVTSDEVTVFYKYGGDVPLYSKGGEKINILRSPTVWELQKSSRLGTNVFENKGDIIYRNRNIKSGKFKQVDLIKDTIKTSPEYWRTVEATPFPYDKPSTHLDWITRKNILEFGTKRYSKLPINLKEYQGFVYSATAQKWKAGTYPAEFIYDKKTGDVIAHLKGALRFGSGKGASEGFLRIGRGTEESASAIKEAVSPTLYANYLRKVQINKAIGELKGVTASGLEVKYPRYTRDTGALGTGNIPIAKKEVETTYEFEKALKIRTAGYLKRGAWRVPVIEEVVGGETELKAIAQASGIKTPISNVGISSLPPSRLSQLNRSILSLISYPKTSKSYSSSVSKVSNISGFSDISRVSRTSRTSDNSKVSKVSRSSTSRISEIMSRISRISASSTTSRIPRSRIPRISPIPTRLAGKIKKMKKFRITPEIEGLFPDFTARAIGLAPKKVSGVEGALREISKLRTGFEVRTGARVRGFSPVAEKSLLRGIMR